MFAYYLWLCIRWNFCNRSTLRENISQSTMCYFFETRCRMCESQCDWGLFSREKGSFCVLWASGMSSGTTGPIRPTKPNSDNTSSPERRYTRRDYRACLPPASRDGWRHVVAHVPEITRGDLRTSLRRCLMFKKITGVRCQKFTLRSLHYLTDKWQQYSEDEQR